MPSGLPVQRIIARAWVSNPATMTENYPQNQGTIGLKEITRASPVQQNVHSAAFFLHLPAFHPADYSNKKPCNLLSYRV
jgi:hypothetical protein